MHLQGATALVTGAAQGLGKAFSEALLSRGASVCLSDVQEQKGKDVELELQKKYGKDRVMFIQCDVRSEETLSNMFNQVFSKFGHIDLMVNNAGLMNEFRVKDMLDINLFAVIKGSQLAMNHMRKDQGGRGGVIVNVASRAGLNPVFFAPSYTATKFGVIGYTLSRAVNPHIKDYGVQMACLCPSFTNTSTINSMDDAIFHVKEAHQMKDDVGVNETVDVAKGFLQLVESDNCNGDVVTVVKGIGVRYNRKNGRHVGAKL